MIELFFPYWRENVDGTFVRCKVGESAGSLGSKQGAEADRPQLPRNIKGVKGQGTSSLYLTSPSRSGYLPYIAYLPNGLRDADADAMGYPA